MVYRNVYNMGKSIMENELYWIWLTSTAGVTGFDITALLEIFDTAEEIYKAESYDGVLGIRPAAVSGLKDKSLKKAEEILKKTEEIGAKVIPFDSIYYPDVLRFTENPPYLLYIRGEILNWDRLLMIGVVGTREATDYGIAATKRICEGLAANGVTIVSGMARGIDAIAARAAIDVGGKTVAVLGCGIDMAYPEENRSLMNAIIKNGAVISEYPPGELPLKTHFPERNRIISGLSKGILVTEAPKKSGALITANYAAESGRDLFSVPGSIFKTNSEGTNALLTQGAKAVASADDILSEYVYELAHLKIEKPKNKILRALINNKEAEKVNNEMILTIDDKKYQGLSESERTIVSLLIEKNMHIDDIKRRSGIDIAQLTPILSMLEFGGYINKLPGNNYKLNI